VNIYIQILEIVGKQYSIRAIANFAQNVTKKLIKNKKMGLFKTTAFEYRGYSKISERSYYLAIVGFILYGLLATYLTTFVSPVKVSTAELICIGCIIPLAGCFVAASDTGIISFLGYNMIVIPFGYILGPTLNHYSANVVQNAALITLFITALFGAAGFFYPKLFKSLGGVLFYSLIGLILVRILAMFIPALNFGIIDYISAGIFSLYIGYDMYRASESSRDYVSALHVAVSLYLDILNLFLSVLSASSND